MDTKLNVVNENNEELTIDVIDIFSVDDSDKEYILYTIGEDVYASILEEDDTTFSLKTIESEDEKKLINERINELIS
ncbi:MAG: DUF1292 domain-containing protein [Bacilli bacterium]|nr:DUF1292 domain-containing protein [Bacilli bacterium]